MDSKLLTRDQFRTLVFERDRHRCVVCRAPAADAHHLLERRLWPDGGYYIENGASVCAQCHLRAESTEISVEELRERCCIARVLVPEHLDEETVYDKWGNPVLPNGQRMRGELFEEESVQKILAPVLHLFTKRVKYPRTYHLPCSPGATARDRIQYDLSTFEHDEVVVTAKLDGENCTMYRDGLHARSLEYDPHPSRDWVKALHACMAFEIPENWRICGENLYAKHSIHYRNLSALFQVFSIWDGLWCLPWDATVAYAKMLDLQPVPVLWRGIWDRKKIEQLWTPTLHGDPLEGFVVRLASGFPYGRFRHSVVKYVRANHVQTDAHWMRSEIVRNEVSNGQ